MNPTPKRLSTRLTGLTLLCGCAMSAFGLPTDSQQRFNLSSEYSHADLKRGVTVHQGNVKLTQGSLRIESDELIVHQNGDLIEKVIATGSPAEFEQQPELGQAPIIASGKRIEYNLQGQVETVAIIDEAILNQGGIVHRCDRIEFNLTESTAEMMGSCVTEGSPRAGDNTPPATSGR